ncbi:MAG: helix-turn-helix domain-containing protein [Phycisphaerales bacterium]
MKRHFERETFTGQQIALPELQCFGWTATPRADDLSLGPHAHHNAYEICLIVDGTVQWWVGHEIYQLGRGDIYITRPDETHGGIDDVMHPCALYWFILPHPGRSPLPGLTMSQTRSLMGALAKLKWRSFASSPELRAAFAQLHHELRDRSMFSPISARAAFHTLLVRLLRDHDQATQHPTAANRPRTPAMRQTMQWIADHLAEDVAVERIAEVVNLSVSRFHERFLAEVGLTPAEYRTHLRIRRAKQLLGQGDMTITRIAHQLGFSTSQYFATVFKKIVGMTPVAYRRRKSSP